MMGIQLLEVLTDEERERAEKTTTDTSCSYQVMKTKFERYYNSKSRIEAYRKDFTNMYQQAHELLVDFHDRVAEL